ncbi:MAG: hypothetical protein RL154_684 [Pseudomonadota bacterium]
MSQTDNSTHTSNIIASIEHYANANEIGHEKVDFEIRGYKTIAKLKNGSLKFQQNIIKPTLFEQDSAIPLDTWLNPDLEIFQEYDILFKPKVFNNKMAIELHLIANKYLTSIVAIIKKESRIAKQPNLREHLINEFNKRKASSKIMIGLYDEQMLEDVDKIVQEIEEHGALAHDIRITLCRCPDYLPSSNDSLRLVFKEKASKDDAPLHKSLISAVNMGEELVIYTKAKQGKSARGINGVFHTTDDAIANSMPQFTITGAVRLDENIDKTVYSALFNGFVVYDGKTLDIQKDLIIDKVDFKTGSIDLGMGMDAKIDITKAKQEEDAIAGGMSAKAYSIKLSGGIGEGSSVYAHDCEVAGQTHSTAYIEATNAIIHNHKGRLIADNAKIKVLENGFVSARVANIDSILGGTVEADQATIGIVGANSKIYIRESLDIKSPNGDGIKIFITTSATEDERKHHNEIASEIDQIGHSIEEKQAKLKTDIQLIEANRETIAKLKSRYTPDSPRAPMIAEQLKKFSLVAKEAKNLSVEIGEAKKLAEKDNELLQREENSLLGATITIINKWKNGGVVRLDIPGSKREVVLQIPDDSDIKRIWIVKENDEYKFKTSK